MELMLQRLLGDTTESQASRKQHVVSDPWLDVAWEESVGQRRFGAL
jgi:hypothetical protein